MMTTTTNKKSICTTRKYHYGGNDPTDEGGVGGGRPFKVPITFTISCAVVSLVMLMDLPEYFSIH